MFSRDSRFLSRGRLPALRRCGTRVRSASSVAAAWFCAHDRVSGLGQAKISADQTPCRIEHSFLPHKPPTITVNFGTPSC